MPTMHRKRSTCFRTMYPMKHSVNHFHLIHPLASAGTHRFYSCDARRAGGGMGNYGNVPPPKESLAQGSLGQTAPVDLRSYGDVI